MDEGIIDEWENEAENCEGKKKGRGLTMQAPIILPYLPSHFWLQADLTDPENLACH